MADLRSIKRPAPREFTFMSFLWRFVGSLGLVAATYNPTDYSFFHWVRQAIAAGTVGPEHFLVGVIILIGWAILIVATRSSLGTLGAILGAALFGAAVWLLYDLGWLESASVSAVTWIVLVCVSGLLAIGLCWAHIWRRITGQVDLVDDDR